jgi:hypothetical protein
LWEGIWKILILREQAEALGDSRWKSSQLFELQVIDHGNWPLGFAGIIFSYDVLYRTFPPWPYEELMRSDGLRVYTITEEASFFVNIFLR